MLWTLAVGLGTELVLQAGWWEFLQRSNWYGNITFRDYSVFNASWLCSTVFIHEYFHGNNLYETMYHLFNYWSFLYIYSCNLGDRIQDSNVSDMKFGWLNLFASRMSSYLNVLLHIGWCWAHQSLICFLFVVQLRICRLFRSILCPWIMYGYFDMYLFHS